MTLFDKLKNAKDENEMANLLFFYMCHWENMNTAQEQKDLIVEYLKKEVGK